MMKSDSNDKFFFINEKQSFDEVGDSGTIADWLTALQFRSAATRPSSLSAQT